MPQLLLKKLQKADLQKSRLFRIMAVILLLPYALMLVYIVVPPVSTPMLADAVTLTWPQRNWVPLGRISPSLKEAVIVAEDGAFCDHFGFDWNQIEKNLDKAMKGKRFGGASTITQQTVKNLFLWNGRSWLRKILEAPLTVWMEIILTKRRILEIYLNTAEWDEGIYGAQAAARHHFGADVAGLSLKQSALLAAALPNPLERNVGNPGPYLRAASASIAARAAAHAADTSCLR